MKKRTVKSGSGEKFTLVMREEAGLVPCTGEAHAPEVAGNIDNCGLCAPRWGEMMSYKPVPLAALKKGMAVAVSATNPRGELGSENAKTFEAAAAEGKVKMEMVTEKTRSHTTTFYAWVLA